MTKQVKWTKIILETFLEESGINDRVKLGDERAKALEIIMRTRCAGWSIPKQALELGYSADNINKMIAELKILYDATQKNSIILPLRKKSKKELDMDKLF